MAVDPGLRRSGVGKALWGWLETLARRGGVDRVQLEVRADNLGASAFYWSLGFREVARLPGYYQAREDALCMLAEQRPRRASAAGSRTGRDRDGLPGPGVSPGLAHFTRRRT